MNYITSKDLVRSKESERTRICKTVSRLFNDKKDIRIDTKLGYQNKHEKQTVNCSKPLSSCRREVLRLWRTNKSVKSKNLFQNSMV